MKDFLAFQKNLHRQESRRPVKRQPTSNAGHPWAAGNSYKGLDNPGGSAHAGVFSRKTAYRPTSIVSRAQNNSSVLTQIRQKYKPKPLHAKQGVYKAEHQHEDLHADFVEEENTVRQNTRRINKRHKSRLNYIKHDNARRFSSSFTMPMLPAMILLILGAVLLMYNRDNISLLLQRDVVSLKGNSTDTNMANYIGTGPLGMADFLDSSETGFDAAPDTDSIDAGSTVSVPQTTMPPIQIVEGETSIAAADEAQNEEIPLKMVEYFTWIDHTVKSGESVSRIADAYGLSMDTVIASNNLTNAHLLRIGQKLRLPNMNGIPYVVKSGDSLSKISRAWSIPLEVIVDANNIQNDLIFPGQTIFLPGARMPASDLRAALGTLFVSPLRGTGARLTSPFGWREDPFDGVQRLHEALDLAIATGTPVKAANSGKVTMVGNSPVYGRYIIISHGGGFQTLYAHLSAVSIAQGAEVGQGVKIGEVGSTGRSTGPHLHFAIYKDGQPVNPLDYLTL